MAKLTRSNKKVLAGWGQITSSGKCILNFYRDEELITVELLAHKLE